MIPDRPLEAPDYGDAVDVFKLTEASKMDILDEVYPEWEEESKCAGMESVDEVLEALMRHPVEEAWIDELAAEYRDRETWMKESKRLNEQVADDIAEELRAIAKLPALARRQAE